MDHKVTIKEVAELAGVSKSTVSRYLNRGYVSEEKRELVRQAIAQTGFKSNFFAKRLKTKESKLIGIVLPRMDSVTVGKLLTGINRVLDPAGYQVLVQVSQLSQRRELDAMRSLQQQGVDGTHGRTRRARAGAHAARGLHRSGVCRAHVHKGR